MATNLEHIFVPEQLLSSATSSLADSTNIRPHSRKSQKANKFHRLSQSDIKKKKKKKILKRLSTLAQIKNGFRKPEEESEEDQVQFSPLSPARQQDFDKKSWDQCKAHLVTIRFYVCKIKIR